MPYECYYGPRHSVVHTILGTNAQRIRTEVGLQLIEDIIRYLKDNNPLTHIEDEKVINIIERGDALYDEEEKLQSNEEKEEFGLEDRRSELFAEILAEILDADDEIEDFLHFEKQEEESEEEESGALPIPTSNYVTPQITTFSENESEGAEGSDNGDA